MCDARFTKLGKYKSKGLFIIVMIGHWNWGEYEKGNGQNFDKTTEVGEGHFLLKHGLCVGKHGQLLAK